MLELQDWILIYEGIAAIFAVVFLFALELVEERELDPELPAYSPWMLRAACLIAGQCWPASLLFICYSAFQKGEDD